MDGKVMFKEPCAGNLLAGICGGLRGVIPSFYPEVTLFLEKIIL